MVSFSGLALAQPAAPAPEVPAAEEADTPEAADAPEAAEPVAEAPAEEAAPEAAPEAEPAPAASAGGQASANASTTTGGGVGAVVQMGDAGDGPSTRGAGSASSSVSNYGGPQTDAEDEWKFGFNGYMRAPMRIGIGSREDAKVDQAETTLSTPQLPNDQYLDWQYTKTVQRSWLESYFSYGNNWAKGVFSIEGFRFSQSSWADPEAQFGVGQAWIEVTPDMTSIDENMRMNAKFGSFGGRYGGAGQYDAGAYDTFVIGRTHTIGEAVRLEYDYQDMVFHFEEGFGTKQPNPSPFHNTKFTLLAHGHAGVNWDQTISLGVHLMHAWTQEPDHDCASREEEIAFYENIGGAIEQEQDTQALVLRFAEGPVGGCKHEATSGADDRLVPLDGESVPLGQATEGGLVRRSDTPDGSLTVAGLDLVFNPGALGRIFFGYSHLWADKAITVAPALEVVHAYGGGFFKSGVTHQYFNGKSQWDSYETMSAGGNGTLHTFELQWDMSLSSLIGPDLFGQQSLNLSLFGLLNLVKSEDDAALENVSKIKFGGDVVYSPTGWFGIGLRGDRVQPRSDIPDQNFTVLAPRLIFRSSFNTHEQIHIGYARYMYAKRECDLGDYVNCVQAPGATVAPDGFGNRPGVNSTKTQRGTPVDVESDIGPYDARGGAINGWDPPHENVVFISADMWW
jgi:hypothetical protein